MLVVTICIFIALLLTILDSKKIIGWGMKVGFILTGILLAIHYDYGSDYMMYYHDFQRIIYNHYSINAIITHNVIRNNEYGWGIINYIFTFLGKDGFFIMVAVLTSIQTWIYYQAIKKYVARSWWWFAVLTYLLNPSFYLMEFSMMRQAFVMSIFLLLFEWIYKKKVIQTLAVIYILSTIHSSAAILYPVAFLGYLPKKTCSFYATIIVVLFIFCFASRSILESIFNNFLQIATFSDYADTYGRDKADMTFGIGFIVLLIPFFVSLYYLYTNISITRKHILFVFLSCVGYIIIPFGLIIPLVGRVGFYFTLFSIISFPIVYRSIREKTLRNSLVALQCIISIYNYFIFFESPIWIRSYSDFNTIFNVL